MRLFRITKAQIPDKERKTFEQFGVNVIGAVLSGGFTPAAAEITPVYNNEAMRKQAREWMTEQHQRTERKDNWMFLMEAAITILVSCELVMSMLDFARCSR